MMSSHWKSEEFEKHIETMRTSRDKIKAEINNKIAEALSLIEKYDPFQLLAVISSKNCFCDPEEYSEITNKGKEAYIEYAQSLIMGHRALGLGVEATEDVIDKFSQLISEILDEVLWYFGSETAEGKRDPIEEQLRFLSISRYLFVRGDSFIEHHFDLVKDLFCVHNAFLQRTIGYTIEEIMNGLVEIERQINEYVNSYIEIARMLKELHGIFINFVREERDKYNTLDEIEEAYHALPLVIDKTQELQALKDRVDNGPFIIVPNEKIPQGLLDLLSSEIGENEPFITFIKAPGWPTNDSIIYSKPLIRHERQYCCFILTVLFRNIGNILDEIIRQADIVYYQNNYQKKRADFLEKKALEYFQKIFPDGQIVHKVFYYVTENGETKKCETDGLVLL